MADRALSKRCGTCAFWEGSLFSEGGGECHVAPPTNSFYPRVCQLDWCGKWQQDNVAMGDYWAHVARKRREE